MQKVIRRATLARNQAKRKAKTVAEKERRETLAAIIFEKTRYNRGILDDAKNERLARREDWLRGPLAPRRHAGEHLATFGTINASRMHPPKIPKEKRRRYLNMMPHDRVCIMKGRDKGKISLIADVNEETEHVTVKDLNVVSSFLSLFLFFLRKYIQFITWHDLL